MIATVLIFTFSSIVSFFGSLQLGPVNLFVINSTLFRNRKTAYYVAIGGCIPEFIYCALAVFANSYLLEYQWLIYSFKLIFILKKSEILLLNKILNQIIKNKRKCISYRVYNNNNSNHGK